MGGVVQNHGSAAFVERCDARTTVVDVERIVTQPQKAAILHFKLARKSADVDTVHIGGHEAPGSLRYADAEVVQRQILAARADKDTDTGGGVDHHVLERNTAAAGNGADRAVVGRIAQLKQMPHMQIGREFAGAYADEVVADHVVVKSLQTCGLLSVGGHIGLLGDRGVITGKSVVKSTLFIAGVGGSNVLIPRDGKLIEDAHVGTVVFPVNGGNHAGSVVWIVCVKGKVRQGDVLAVFELKDINTVLQRPRGIKMRHNLCAVAVHPEAFEMAQTDGMGNMVRTGLEVDADGIGGVGNAVKDGLKGSRAVEAGIRQDAAVGQEDGMSQQYHRSSFLQYLAAVKHTVLTVIIATRDYNVNPPPIYLPFGRLYAIMPIDLSKGERPPCRFSLISSAVMQKFWKLHPPGYFFAPSCATRRANGSTGPSASKGHRVSP